MDKDEALKLALEVLEQLQGGCTDHDDGTVEAITVWCPEVIDAIKAALAQPVQEPVACVYKATTKKGETAHFGEYSTAKAWAGWGTVEQVPLKTLTLISKSIKPCPTCEALARTVMLDQTSHDTNSPQRTWVGLTDQEIIDVNLSKVKRLIDDPIVCDTDHNIIQLGKAIEAKLKEKNT